MRLGLINQLNGRSGGDQAPPTWESISARAIAAENAGFDIFVFEDALVYRNETVTDGVWESMTIAAALAATTSRMRIGQSVVNSPYRSPALTASIATTLDEVSGGRYVLGIGSHGLENPISGSSDEIATQLLECGALGFEEIRVDLWPKTVEAIETMTAIVSAVHNEV